MRYLTFLSILLVIIQKSNILGQLADSPWPMFQHDPQHTGRSSAPGISQPMLKWEFQTKSHTVGSAAIGSDGTIYLVSGLLHSDTTGFLYAINPDGTEKWCFELIGPPSYTTPAIAQDGTIYVHCNPHYNLFGNTFLYAINSDGTLKWMFNLGGAFTSSEVSSPVIGSDGTIYFGSANTLFYAISPDGELKWSWNIDRSSIDSSPAISSTGSIYIRAMFHLTAFSSSGNLLWSTSVGSSGSMQASPAISNDGTIYIGKDHTLYAYNPNGELKWKYGTGDWPSQIVSTPAIASDSTIYLVDYDGLYALNANGKLKWHYNTWGAGCGSPTIAGDGTIYFRDMWQFYAIDRNGKLKWKLGENWSGEMQGTQLELQGAPIGADGTLYITKWGSLRAYTDKSIFVGPDIVIDPASKDFGKVLLGDTVSQIFKVTNTGKTDLVVAEGGTILEGWNADQFTIVSGGAPFTVLPLSSYEVTVSFHPDTTESNVIAFMRIISNDPDESPLSVGLQGWGVVPDIEIDPTSLKFGSRNVGSFYDDYIYLSNYGQGDLKVTTTSITGPNATDFQIQSGGGPFTLEPYHSPYHYIKIRFSPLSVGAKTASLSISSNDPDENPLLVVLTGQALPSVGIDDETASLPTEFKLLQNYPNPFNPKTTIEFQLPKTGLATLSVFDLKGMEVRSLISGGIYAAGIHTVVWDAIDNQGQKTATGIYFYRLEISPSEKSAAKFVAVKKMILTK